MPDHDDFTLDEHAILDDLPIPPYWTGSVAQWVALVIDQTRAFGGE